MSAKKDYETKLGEDENTDSGFLTGEISGPCDPEPTLSEPEKKDDNQKKEECELDSGLVLISEELSSVHITETTLKPPPTKSSDIPPLNILFQQDDDGDT